MRPATRVVPKALLTVIDKPAIQYAVEEAARAGATEAILIVDLDAGHLIQQHFLNEGRLPGLEKMKIRPVVQVEPLGLGHAVWEAKEMVRDRHFFCLLADNIVHPGSDVLPAMAAIADAESSVVCLAPLTDELTSRKGVIVPRSGQHNGVVEIAGAVEKPGPLLAPSRLGIIGRYLFSPEVFDILEGLAPGVGGEIQVTDAIDELGKRNRCRGWVAEGDLLDVGNPEGLVQASVELGVRRFGPEFRSFLESTMKS
jgi:UTP--glucose-1-phosphate uridylyltransferase